MKFKEIVVSPDFESSGIWRKGKKSICGIMIDYEDLRLPVELRHEFEFWIMEYDRVFFPLASGIKEHLEKRKVNRLNRAGLILSRKLRKLFPETKISYYGEDCDGKIKEPIDII